MKSPTFAGSTDTGRQRDHNEDAYALAPELGIAVLADGMGGHNAGEVASEMAIGTTISILSQTQGLGARDRLETAIQAAHAGIREKAAISSRYHGMGTTVVAVLVDGDTLAVGHVGDSRLYRLRKGELAALTRDHSLLQEFIDKGLYTPEEAREKVARNILTQALGLEESVRVDIGEFPLQAGDRYLLCSDGLYEMVSDSEIAALLGRRMPLADICTALTELANAKGGKDNITVVVIDT
ncbi:MAG: protein phosphatase [Moraxellaceae bacterium]|jgi:protein phosphatase|nr:protein phosphatase [Moraxellaceae bacterium]